MAQELTGALTMKPASSVLNLDRECMQLASQPSSQDSIADTSSAEDKLGDILSLIKRKSPHGKHGPSQVFLPKLWSQMPLPDSQHPQWLDTDTMNRSASPLLTRGATDRVSKNVLTKGRRGLNRSFSLQSFSHHSLLYGPLSIMFVFRRQEPGQGLRETFQMIHDLESSRNLIQLFPNMG